MSAPPAAPPPRRRRGRAVGVALGLAVLVVGIAAIVDGRVVDLVNARLRASAYELRVDAFFARLADPGRSADERAADATDFLDASGRRHGPRWGSSLEDDPVNFASVPVRLGTLADGKATMDPAGPWFIRRAHAGCRQLAGALTLAEEDGAWQIASLPQPGKPCTAAQLRESWGPTAARSGSLSQTRSTQLPRDVRARLQRIDVATGDGTAEAATAWRSGVRSWGRADRKPVLEYALPARLDVVRIRFSNGASDGSAEHGRIAQATISAGGERTVLFFPPDGTSGTVALNCAFPAADHLSVRVDAVYPAAGRAPSRSDAVLAAVELLGTLPRADAPEPSAVQRASVPRRLADGTYAASCDGAHAPSRPRVALTAELAPGAGTTGTGATYSFTTAASATDRVYWQFGDGTAIRRQTGGVAAHHAYRRAGDFRVTATVMTSRGVSAAATIDLAVARAGATTPEAAATPEPEASATPVPPADGTG